MKSYFKTSLALAAALLILIGCSKQASAPTNNSAKEDKTAQSSESKQSTEQSSEKKETTKTHTFVNKSNSGITWHCTPIMVQETPLLCDQFSVIYRRLVI